jgi:glycosyltransferase involved in cell wall biosynthesis
LSIQTKSAKPDAGFVLYLTSDGILEPLGASQVVAYLVGLSRLGYRYRILSLEKESDLADDVAVTRLREQLRAEEIQWRFLPYRGGTAVRLARMYRNMLTFARQESSGATLVHARSFVMGVLARRLYKLGGPPYIFDARGYWVDERAEAGRWFRLKPVYRLAKALEHKIARDAAAIVTLTDLQRDDFRARFPGKPVETITTCVDFERFRPEVFSDKVPEQVRARITGKVVLGLIGSLNASYRIREGIRLFQFVREITPRAHLLCMTRQQDEMRVLLAEAGIRDEDFTIATASHSDMPAWIAQVHWGLLLLESTYAKRASMPTKFGEMLAAGVRPVQYGCNDEVAQIVRTIGSGIVLESTSDDRLRETACQIAAIGWQRDGLAEARERAREHFSLENGTMKYAQLLQQLERPGEAVLERQQGSEQSEAAGNR